MPLAVPGTVVNSGSGVGPGGDFGQQGPAGALGNEDVGSIKAWPSVTPPAGWLACDGSGQSSTLYPQLFAIVGTTYGAGNGTTTNFNLPDLRGRFICGVGQSNAPGNTNHVLAAAGGEEKHTLTVAELASHGHTATSSSSSSVSDPTHIHNYTLYSGLFNVQAGSGSSQIWAGTGAANVTASGTGVGVTTATTTSIAANGSNTPHNTMPPFLVLLYIIKVSPTGGPTAQAPLADTTQPGLVRTLSGLASDYISGQNQCTPLPFVTRVAVAFTLPPLGGSVAMTVNNASWMSAGFILNVYVAATVQQVEVQSISGNVVTIVNYAGPQTGVVAAGSMVTYGDFAIAGPNQPGVVNALSGNASDYIGGDNICHALPPGIGPTADWYDKDDFIAGGSTTSSKLFILGNSGAAGAVSGFMPSSNYPGHPGNIQLAPGNTASAWSRAYMPCAFAAFDGNMTLTISSVLMIGNFSGPNQFWFGVDNGVGPVIDTAHAYCGFLALQTGSTGANWAYYARNLAVAVTYLDTGVPVGAAGTWHKFTIQINGGVPSLVNFYIDDNLVGTISDNSLPTSTTLLYVNFHEANSSGTNNYSMVIDTFDILVQPGGNARFQR